MRIEGIPDDVDYQFDSRQVPAWFNRLKELDEQLGGGHTWKTVYSRGDYYWVEQSGDWYKVMEDDSGYRKITFYEASLL